MPTFTYPGVYIQELPSAVHTITGVATSIAAFVGWAPQGPTDRAVLVQSWSDFANQFGGLDSRSYLGYSVNQFFGNGGQQAYIVRLVQSTVITTGAPTGAKGSVAVSATGGSLTFTATNVGSWSNSYGIQIAAGTNPNTFKIMVVYAPAGVALAVLETFDNLKVSSSPTITSNYVTLALSGPPTANPNSGFFILTGGADGNGVNVPAATAASVAITGITFDSNAPPSKVTISTGSASGLTLSAANQGIWGNNYAIQIQPKSDDYTRFSLSVVYIDPATGNQTTAESFQNLSVSSTDPQARYVVNVIKEQSRLITASMASSPLTITNTPSIPGSSTPSNPGSVGLGASVSGNDGYILSPSIDPKTKGALENALNSDPKASGGGIHFLDAVPIFNLLCVPGEVVISTISDLQAYCVTERAFLIVDSQSNDSFTTLQNGPTGLTGTNSMNSAFYFPWINQFDPKTNLTKAFPPCGFMAGIYAATDSSRGVWKAPAGIDASLTGESGLTTVLTDIQNGTLNVQAINCLRNFPVYGDVVWGARTLQGNDQAGSQWKYVPIRRFALFLESSLFSGTQWVVFEPNDETLWGQIRLNIGAFMQNLFLQGAFQGTTPAQAYFVKCDAENNPQSSIDLGIVNILVGFAPLFPAEFVVIQIQQMAGQIQQ